MHGPGFCQLRTDKINDYVIEASPRRQTYQGVNYVEGTERVEKTSETTTQNQDKHLEALGEKVAKDFGKQGVFFGSAIAVEYDSDDHGKENPFYVVQYTDGDKEDLNEEEYGYAHELCVQMDIDAVDEFQVDSATDEEESYLPSPKVQ